MTITTSGSLHYGYDLGGGDQPWRVRQITASGASLRSWEDLPWYEPDSIFDFRDQANLHLARLGGAADPSATDDPAPAAAARAGARVECYSWDASPSYVLVAGGATAFYDTPEQVDLLELIERRKTEDWDLKLDAALRHLGITTSTARPGWMVTAHQ